MNNKPAWLYRQSGVIPFLMVDGVLSIVLVTSTRNRSAWGMPKGVIERDMTPQASAEKEAWEEAGVTGRVADRMLLEYQYEKWEGICNVKVYPMEVIEVLDCWDEMRKRSRTVVELDNALELIKPAQRPALVRFKEEWNEWI